MDVVKFANALHTELQKDGWRDVSVSHLEEVGRGSDAGLSDDAFALKQAMKAAIEKVEANSK